MQDEETSEEATTEIVVAGDGARRADVEACAVPAVGEWYWLRADGEKEDAFVCVTHVGSNYVEATGVFGAAWRVHADELDKMRREHDPEAVIAAAADGYQREVHRLLGRVRELTARLGVAQVGALPPAAETAALARIGEGTADVATYKAALTRAKEETLPDLFKQIERANEGLVRWMKARVIPLRAQAGGMNAIVASIDDRIFNVELYAGLSEKIVEIARGEPAARDEKVRLFQRRLYMDEEALLRYETGGMTFDDIGDFDRWMARPENRDRLLPFPRCVASFRVRRHDKERVPTSFLSFFQACDEIAADRLTFLYLRNGERLYRMATALDFGGVLFPHTGHDRLRGKVWAKLYCGSIKEIIGDDDYRARCDEYDAAKAEHEAEKKAFEAERSAWKRAKAEAEARGEKYEAREPWNSPWFHKDDPRREFRPFSPGDVYYDDIKRKIDGEIRAHNRVVLVLQGLFDRSPVFHPHPPWRLWTDEGMGEAVELVYDQSAALVAGPPPDFEAYRAECNASLGPGSVTVGQQEAWERQEAKKLAERTGRDRERFAPYGNPGPGTLAVVESFAPKKRACTYAWEREAVSADRYGAKIRATCEVPAEEVFNVSAYTPGDFLRFFDDPRTREDYLDWAPLLEAEEYHAGNRELKPPPKKKPKPPATAESRRKAERARELRAFVGKLVVNTSRITTRGGKTYEPGLLWRADRADRGLAISRVTPDGARHPDGGFVRGVEPHELRLHDA